MAKKSRSKRRRTVAKPSRAPWILGAIAVAALVAIPIVIEAVKQANEPGERFASQGNRHVALGAEVPPYNSDPPTSGPHTESIAAWGSYGPEDTVPDQNLVHNMEDGGVIVWYRPADDPEETRRRLSTLETLSSGYRHVVIVPRPEMPTDYALTAWRRLQRFDEIEEEGMLAFLQAYEGTDHHGP